MSYYHSYPHPATTGNTTFLQQNPPPDNFDESSPPKTTSNTYHETQIGNNNWPLPQGFKIAHRETDGRMYYFELATGKSSWNHPYSTTTNQPNERGQLETPLTASKRPDSHQCIAVFASLVFPPLGIFALIHSIMTYICWNKKEYGNAYDHSRQASNFASWSILIFIGFGVYHFFQDGAGFDTLNFYQWYIQAFR